MVGLGAAAHDLALVLYEIGDTSGARRGLAYAAIASSGRDD